MKIKKYIQFVKESTGYDYGCVMVEVPVSNWDEICSSIDKEDIYEEENDTSYGIQKNPHLTLLYGTAEDVSTEDVKELLEGTGEIKIQVNGIDIFENDKFDVVKFNVEKTEQLQNLFNKLSNLPNENTFKDYTPHMTIAYVKKGMGKKYIKPNYNHSVISNEICFSKPNGEKIYFEI